MTDFKSPPHSNAAEQALLGAAMLAGPDSVSWLTVDDFFPETHRLIWQAITECDRSGDGYDPVTVSEWFAKNSDMERIENGAYLTGLANDCPGTANIKGWAKTLREHCQRRKLIALGVDITDRALDNEPPTETIDYIESQVIDWAGHTTNGPRSILQAAASWFDRLDTLTDQSQRVDTGLIDVDKIVMGLLPSELIVIAGRPGMGKTAGAMTIARNIGAKHPVLFFSLEMSGEQLVKRMVAQGISGDKLRNPHEMTPHDWDTVRDGVRNLKRYQIHVDDTGGLNIYQLAARAKAWKKNHGIRAIFIDYLQLITCKSENRFSEVSEVSRQLKKLAKDLDVPVIVLSQLNRKLEDRPDKRPRQADLRESGQIEQDADIIIFLYRHSEYHEDFDSNIAEWIVEKHRDAQTGTAFTLWQGHKQTFVNATPDAIAEYHQMLKPENTNGRTSRFQEKMAGVK